MKRFAIAGCTLGFLLGTLAALGQHSPRPLCQDNATLCTETSEAYNYEGQYVGHDEPSVLFYSATAGSGNSSRYRLILPADPKTFPNQSGTAGTWNFQLHPAFWFGMAICDSQSAPNPGAACTPDTDANIFDNADPTAPDFIGKHPGTAFMEMQFYPPGWVAWPPGVSCDATHWCAALNIDSFSENMNTNTVNNTACLESVGIEPVNFAFITKSGTPLAPPSPVNATLATFTPDLGKILLMNPRDELIVDLRDTSSGLQVTITDLTTGEQGSMVASAANGFGQVKFDPTATTCTNIPYDFHPMYATSSEHTRVPWAAHSYNIAFSDEIGHFEYCDSVDANGNCTSAGGSDARLDADDAFCFDGSASTLVPISGCLSTDVDFDGVPYQLVWPGTAATNSDDVLLHPRPVRFSSPTFNDGGQNYSRVAFETDLPRIEFATSPACNRSTGAHCVNPPAGANFYPIFSTTADGNGCKWQLGGAAIPGTKDTFGGTSTAEYGDLLLLAYPVPGGVVHRYNNFRQVLSSNPCPSF